MKVLMVIPGFHPVKGGAETIVKGLSIKLNDIGIQTHVMTFNMDKKWSPKWRREIEVVDRIKIFKIPALKLLPSSPRINMNVNLIPGNFVNIMKQYDIIHFHEAELSFPLFSFLIKKPKILHLHGINVDFIKRYHIYRMMFKHVTTYYIAITKEMKDNLTKLGICQSRIFYLPNAIDTELFHPDNNKKDDNLILYLGRITPVKGLHILLESLRYLRRPVRLVIIGPVNDLRYYEIIMRLMEKENQKGKNQVEHLGVLPLKDVIKFYQKATVFILPSYWEAFPLTLLEALSCGTPIVATPVGGVPEVIKNHETGILVPPGNALRLAEAIDYLLENKDVRLKMVCEGQKLVRKQYSLEIACKKLCSIYKQFNELNCENRA
ncbi:MAG: glycosyltransferase family 4 protein [Candidatus Bathyarchaeia archaeon]